MKRILSLFLSMVLISSMILGTFTVNVFAEVTGGSFTNYAGTVSKTFEETFSNWTEPYPGGTSVNGASDQGYTFFRRRNTLTGANNQGTANRPADIEFATRSANDRYMKFKDVGSDGYIYPRYNFKTNMSAMSDGEKLYFSIDVIVNDKNYDKHILLSNHDNMNGNYISQIIRFDNDGGIYFFKKATSAGTYETDTWYNIKMLYDSSDDSVKVVIDDGNEIYRTNYEYALNTIIGKWEHLGFVIDHTVANTPDPSDSTKAQDVLNASFGVDNIRMIFFDDSKIITEKPLITKIGSDGNIVDYTANEIEFTVDSALENIKAADIKIKLNGDVSNIVSSINSVIESGVTKVKATLDGELFPWTDYTLEIDSKAVYSDGYYEITSDGFPKAIDPLKGSFQTNSAPLSLKSPEFSLEDDTLTVTTAIKNTADTRDMILLVVKYDANGAVTGFEEIVQQGGTDEDGEEHIFDVDMSDDSVGAKVFVINDWSSPSPVFESYGSFNAPAVGEAIPTSDAAPNEMTFGEFNNASSTITANINVGSSAEITGMLYVYKRGAGMYSRNSENSNTENLLYADLVTTASDGTIAKDIVFKDDIDEKSGEYSVKFVYGSGEINSAFSIYDENATVGSLVKKLIDTSGKKYSEYGSELSGIWDFHKMTVSEYDSDPTAIKIVHNDSYITIDNNVDGMSRTSGKHIVSFKIYAENKSSGEPNIINFAAKGITVNRINQENNKYTGTSFSLPTMEASKWYEIRFEFDLDDAKKVYMVVIDVESGEEVARLTHSLTNSTTIKDTFSNMRMDIRCNESLTNLFIMKDFQFLTDVEAEKPAIRFVGNSDVVDYGQKNVKFKISHNIDILAEDIYVTDENGATIKTVNVTTPVEDRTLGGYTVTATLESELVSWKNYTLNINMPECEDYREPNEYGLYVPVTPIVRDFSTPAAPVDIVEPSIDSDGSNITVASGIRNATSSEAEATLVLTVCGSDGIMRVEDADSITASGNTDTPIITPMNVSGEFKSGETAKIFSILDWSTPVQRFDRYWSVNHDGSIPEIENSKSTAKAQAKAISFDKFDYDTDFDYVNNKINMHLNTGNASAISGVLAIYEKGAALADSNLPVYIDYITVASDGTYEKEIFFADDIIPSSGTKEYVVEFRSRSLGYIVKNEFLCLGADAYTEHKLNKICEYAKSSTTFSGLMQIITGTDEFGNKVNENFTLFKTLVASSSIIDYNSISNKENVYINLLNKLSSVSDKNSLARKFEEAVSDAKGKENNPQPVNPGANNKTPGSSSVSMSATPAAGSSNAGASVGGGSVFSDMTGHWGQKYAEALVAKGIVNGYADGSFRGDNPITRAELTKIVVEALDVPEAGGAAFGDVISSSWYADYVSRANASGVVNGFEDGTFRPEANVSRQDAVLMIWRAMNLTAKLPEGYKFFADEKDIQDYASDAIRCLGDLGIITGNDSKFMPLNNITRAEMAAVICRAIDYMESHMQ